MTYRLLSPADRGAFEEILAASQPELDELAEFYREGSAPMPSDWYVTRGACRPVSGIITAQAQRSGYWAVRETLQHPNEEDEHCITAFREPGSMPSYDDPVADLTLGQPFRGSSPKPGPPFFGTRGELADRLSDREIMFRPYNVQHASVTYKPSEHGHERRLWLCTRPLQLAREPERFAYGQAPDPDAYPGMAWQA